jgi:hypothetical protein
MKPLSEQKQLNAFEILCTFPFTIISNELTAAVGMASQASDMLVKALKRFPFVASILSAKCQTVVPEHQFFNTNSVNRSEQSLEALCTLYVERAYSVWKAPEIIEWFQVCF